MRYAFVIRHSTYFKALACATAGTVPGGYLTFLLCILGRNLAKFLQMLDFEIVWGPGEGSLHCKSQGFEPGLQT